MLLLISNMKNTKNIIGIGIFLILLLAAAGGYYEWINAIGGIFLSVWFLFLSRKNKAEVSMETYLIVPFLFALCLLFFPMESRKKLLFFLSETACLLTAFSLLFSLIPALRSYIFMAGRFAGTFGYANTYALFLFLALLLLISREKSTCVFESVKKIGMGLFLIIGLFLTGSRYTWLLCFVILIVYALHEKARHKHPFGMGYLSYPYYTDALTANLSLEEDADTAKELAHRILKQNDTVSLAYDALAETAFLENDFSAMTRSKETAIRYNKFDKNEYISYLSMLNEMLATDEFHTAALAKMKSVLSLIETNKKSVSSLGKKIDDKVDIDLPAEVVKEISEG